MIDSCPMTKTRYDVLDRVYGRIDEMKRRGIDLFDPMIALRDELLAKSVDLNPKYSTVVDKYFWELA